MRREVREHAVRQYEAAREATRQEDARLAALAAREAEHARETEELERQLVQEQQQQPSASAAAIVPSSDEEGSSDEDE